MEAKRKDNWTKGEQDTDIVLTTTELCRMIKSAGIDFNNLAPDPCDNPFGIGSGGGVIFGVTGGVTEAVLRRLSESHDPATLQAIAECGIRGNETGIKEATIPYNGIDVKICVISGLANAHQVMQQVKSGEKQYHLIEVMACRGGCVNGGGQPVQTTGMRDKVSRPAGLYDADNKMAVRNSDENPLMDLFYSDPLFKGKVHELCHRGHE